ncbi:MAG: PadR family transcriptional regulator [Hydrogenophilaceae bacterium]|jgi:PadR family transcriptional regulator PadR|nr:PadR family transcriptional regulator [Hydrogenophilaceae bacterium]
MEDRFPAVRKGLLEFALLRIIAGARVYAADILTRLADTEFATQEGTLYPLLAKLRREDLVDHEWVESGAGPPRKYYALTAKGADRLKELTAYWERLNADLEDLGR